jgi:hypothetical protein
LGDWLFEPRFEPRLKPREAIQIAGKYYEVVETRPMLPFHYKLTEITAEVSLSAPDLGLKGLENEVLNYRLKIYGPVKVSIRIEGAGGPVFGGYGNTERFADEATPESLMEFVQLSDRVGYPYITASPVATPAWLKILAYGWVYVVREAARPPATYMVPPYIWKASEERR